VSKLLFPPKCVLCGKILEKGELDLCGACRTEMADYPLGRVKIPFVEEWAALWHYDGNARKSLLRYKFYCRRNYAQNYGRLLAMRIDRQWEQGFDVISWVPISRRRKLRRGYDQVELLARAVCRELNVPCVRCLKKIRHNPPQSGIVGQAQRRANVLGVYAAVKPEQFRDKRILLLDDIITTGATVSEAARVLLTAGAQEVYCVAVAAAKNDKK
jgi:ComF family protein